MTASDVPTFAVPPGFLGLGRREHDAAEITSLAAATMVYEYLVLAAAVMRPQDRSV